MNEIVNVFENAEFGSVRTVTIDGEPWFVGKDVAEILGYERATKAVVDHVDEEDRKMIDGKTQSCFGIELGQRGGWLINESGLYCLTIASKLPSVKQFKRWITSEVLPTIRKTGGYSITGNRDSYMITDPIERAKRWIEEEQERRQLRETVQEQTKEIVHKEDVIIGLVDEISVADKRQILNRVVRYKHANYRERWNLLYREFENKYHIDLSRRIESYNNDNKPKCRSKVDYIDRIMHKIPELYELAAKLFENDVKELVEEMYGCVA